MKPNRRKKWYVYIIKCKNDSLYTGLTENVERRFQEHLSGKGSSYTKLNLPIKVVYTEEFYNYREALKRERQIKGWTLKKKEALITGNLELLKKL